MDLTLTGAQAFLQGVLFFILQYVESMFGTSTSISGAISSNIGQTDKTNQIALLLFGVSCILAYSFVQKWFTPVKLLIVILALGVILAATFFKIV